MALLMFLCSQLMEAQRVLRLGLEQGMMNGKVLDFAQDAKGRIWMATEGGLHCWDGFSFTIYTTANSGLAENQLNAVLADADGEHLWIGTQHDGLCRLHIPSGKWETWKAADGLLADGITHIEADPLGGIWITYYLSGVDFRATNGSLIHYDASTVKGLEGTNWTAITNGKRQLYIGHVAQGLSVIDLKTRRHTSYVHQPSDPHSIMNNSVRSLCRDAKGLVWVGTEQGVSVFNPESGRFIRHIPTASQVTALLPLNDGNVLIGELNRGEHAMFQDRAGNIWKSDGRQGVRVYCHERLPFEYIDTTFTAVTMPGFDMVQDTCKSPSGYWVATPNGLWHVDAQGVKTEMTAINRQLQVKNINSLCTDRRGRLWLGTFGAGLYVFEPNGRLVAHRQKAPSTNINMLFCDSRGQIWVATRNGLAHYPTPSNPAFVSIYDAKAGLHDPFLWALAEDKDGDIWASCTTGMICLSPQTGKVTNFTHSDGIPCRAFVKNRPLHSHDGHIIFSLEQGACAVSPAEAKKKKVLPHIFVSAIIHFPMARPTGAAVEQAARLKTDGSIRLKHNDNSFAVSLGVADVAQADRTRFQYQLLGLSEKWYALPAGRQTLTIHGLAPGRYTLRIRASLPAGNWIQQNISIPITVSQPWWWTWWARAAYVCCLLLFVGYEWHQYQLRLGQSRKLDRRLTTLYATSSAHATTEELQQDLDVQQPTVPPQNVSTDATEETVKKEIKQVDREFLDRLDHIILENLLRNDLDMQLLSSAMHMSHSTLYRRIKELTGMTGSAYVRRHRLSKAMQLLSSGISVAEVSMQCGFNSQSYFTRCFKAEYGILPSEV